MILICVLSLLFSLTSIECLHFVSGIIMAKPLGETAGGLVNVEFTVRISYTRNRHFCDDATIASGSYISEQDDIKCQIGCQTLNEVIGTTRIKCTAYSIINDWILGEDKFIKAVPKTAIYAASTRNGDWRDLKKYTPGTESSKDWEIRITIDTLNRSDIGVINTSPVTFVPPVIQLRAGQKYTLKLPTYDVNGDTVKCRWAEDAKNECDSLCHTVPFGVINETACTVTFDLTNPSTYSIGWYGAALQVEDFQTPTSPTAMSSVPVQFLISIDASSSTCTIPPIIPADSCIAVPFNEVFTNRVIATAKCPSGSIKEIQVIGPFGTRATKSAVLSGQQSYSDISWTPDNTTSGGNLICVIASDNNDMSSALSCFTIVYGVIPPRLQNSTAYPTGLLTGSYLLGINGSLEFQIGFSATVNRPNKNAYIRVYLKNGTEIVTADSSDPSKVSFNGTMIYFKFPIYTFIPGDYYVTFDQGVGIGERALPDLCDPDSSQIFDSTFWVFKVPESPLNFTGINNTCTDLLYNQFFGSTTFTATIGVPGVTYVTDIKFTVSTGAGLVLSALTQVAGDPTSWYRTMSWTPTSADYGLHQITVTAMDNANQYSKVYYRLSVVDTLTDPSLKVGSGIPYSVLTDTFLYGNNGFMTFRISFVSNVNRPTSPVYLRVYSLSGTEYVKLDCSSSGFVYYIGDTMFFDIPVDTFPAAQTYYVQFDEGVAYGSSFCISKSPAINSTTFWQFTVPANYTGRSAQSSTASKNTLCSSILVDTITYTQCTQSSLMLLLFLLPGTFFLLHLATLGVLILCLRKPTFKTVEVHPYYFQLVVPSTFKFSAKDKSTRSD